MDPGVVVFQQDPGVRTRLVRRHVDVGRFDHDDLPDFVGYRPFSVQSFFRG